MTEFIKTGSFESTYGDTTNPQEWKLVVGNYLDDDSWPTIEVCLNVGNRWGLHYDIDSTVVDPQSIDDAQAQLTSFYAFVDAVNQAAKIIKDSLVAKFDA